jgi:UDP-N-acetylmuramate dehydrogenase
MEITPHIEKTQTSTEQLIETNVSLADKNWFLTGGAAQYFAQPKTESEFAAALDFARTHNLEISVLGSGANILISDAGVQGLVIRPALKQVEIISQTEHTAHIKAGAGISIHDLIEWCLDHHLLGLEEFSGIPGTLGGATYINIHYYEFLLETFIIGADVIDKSTGKIMHVDKNWFEFGYDHSKLFDKQYFVTNVFLELKKATPEDIMFARGRRVEIIRHRQKRYPYERTCGSFFRNFFPEEVANTQSKLIFVAYYLDQLGLKGHAHVGGAKVSHQHANMIVSSPGATSQDIVDLARLMQTKVFETFGILPQAECQMLGFAQNPLLNRK